MNHGSTLAELPLVLLKIQRLGLRVFMVLRSGL